MYFCHSRFFDPKLRRHYNYNLIPNTGKVKRGGPKSERQETQSRLRAEPGLPLFTLFYSDATILISSEMTPVWWWRPVKPKHWNTKTPEYLWTFTACKPLYPYTLIRLSTKKHGQVEWTFYSHPP
jgi:hypothetical protein